MAPTTVLVTGGNRGVGAAIVKKFLALANHTVIAANRDPNHPTSKALATLPKGEGSKVIVVKYDAGVEGSAFEAVKQAQEQGVAHLDVVVVNAAIVKSYPLVKDAKRSDLLEHYGVNVFGLIEAYQATRDLLQKSTGKPVLALIGSAAGSIQQQLNIPSALYGPTKAAVAWYGVRINAEDEWLKTFVIHPGFVQTDMGNAAASHFEIEGPPVTEEESANGIYNIIATGTREKYGGKLVNYTGEILTL